MSNSVHQLEAGSVPGTSLTMELQEDHWCAICAAERAQRGTWFLRAESRGEDKLRILHWDGSLASHDGIQASAVLLAAKSC
jgi:hypothetical protein